jgi:hypothetical protein
MAPTRVREPFHRDGWVYEEKIDGWPHAGVQGPRARATRQPQRPRSHSALPRAAVAKLSARSLVLDGEVAIYDQQLRSRFDWLREPDPDVVATPPMFMVFDLLHCDGREWLFPCASCRGQGRIVTERIVRIPVPPLVRPESIIEMPLHALGMHNLYLRLYVRIE